MTGVFSALLVAVVLTEAFMRTGRVLLRVVPGGGRGPWSGVLRLVAGWFACGTLMLGLAAAGIFRPAVVAGAMVLWVAGCGVATGARPHLPALAGWLIRLDRRAGAACLVLLGVLALRANTPELEGDCHLYHLALTDGWRAGGKLLIDHIPFAQQLPLPFDAAFAVPVLLDDDRIARWMVLIAFIGGLGLIERPGGAPAAMALGAAFLLSGFQSGRYATVAKNDIVATVAVVAGILRVAAGHRLSGWLVCGLGIAGKLVYGPLVAVALAAWRPRGRRAAVVVLAALVLPVLPWWSKSGLALGHPFVPALAGWFPVTGWDARNWEAVYLHQRGFWVEQVWTPASFLRAYAITWREESIWLALAVPLGMLGGGSRVLTVALAGGAVTLLASHVVRYLLPATWLVAIAVAGVAARPGGRWRTRLAGATTAALFAVACWRIVIRPDQGQPSWRDAFRPAAGLRDAHSVTRAELDRWIVAARPGRILTVGELRAYRFGGRVVYGGALGETPVAWKLSRESRSATEIAKRVRQLGVDAIVYNYVTAIWNRKYAYKFAWSDGQFGPYVDFCGGYTRPIWASDHFDFVGGGYVALGVDRRPRPGKEPVPYLPGAELLSLVGYDPAKGQSGQVSLERAIELTRTFPRALPNFADLGDFYCRLERWPEAYAAILPVWKAGVRNSSSMAAFGTAAGRVGRFDEAEAGLREAMRTYATGDTNVQLGLAEMILTRATVDGTHGRFDQAVAHALRVHDVLNALRPAATAAETERRAAISAVAIGLRADIARVQGRGREARDLYREALAQGPRVPGREAWAQRLREFDAALR